MKTFFHTDKGMNPHNASLTKNYAGYYLIKFLDVNADSTKTIVIGVNLHPYNVGEIKDLTMDEDTLQRIATISGGAYFRATDTGALEEISTRIGQLEKTEAESRTAFLPTPLYRIPLGIAMVALLGLGIFPEGRRRFATRVASA